MIEIAPAACSFGARVAVERRRVVHGQHNFGDASQRRQKQPVHRGQRRPLEVDHVRLERAQLAQQPTHVEGVAQAFDAEEQGMRHAPDQRLDLAVEMGLEQLERRALVRVARLFAEDANGVSRIPQRERQRGIIRPSEQRRIDKRDSHTECPVL